MNEDDIIMGEEPKKETKREKFVRLAEYRTNKILDMIRILGNCSNRVTNEYTDADVEQIFGAIEEALQEAKSRFVSPAAKKAAPFVLNPRFPTDDEAED